MWQSIAWLVAFLLVFAVVGLVGYLVGWHAGYSRAVAVCSRNLRDTVTLDDDWRGFRYRSPHARDIPHVERPDISPRRGTFAQLSDEPLDDEANYVGGERNDEAEARALDDDNGLSAAQEAENVFSPRTIHSDILEDR